VGDPAAGNDNAAASTWLAALLVVVAVCAGLMLFSRRGGLGTRAAVLGATAGILYGVSATLMKPVMEDLNDVGLSGVLESWEVWVMAVAGLVGFYLQQLSLSTGRLVTSVATVSVANPVVSVILGALVLEERLGRNPPGAVRRDPDHLGVGGRGRGGAGRRRPGVGAGAGVGTARRVLLASGRRTPCVSPAFAPAWPRGHAGRG
jgi:hypothetical protein